MQEQCRLAHQPPPPAAEGIVVLAAVETTAATAGQALAAVLLLSRAICGLLLTVPILQVTCNSLSGLTVHWQAVTFL